MPPVFLWQETKKDSEEKKENRESVSEEKKKRGCLLNDLKKRDKSVKT